MVVPAQKQAKAGRSHVEPEAGENCAAYCVAGASRPFSTYQRADRSTDAASACGFVLASELRATGLQSTIRRRIGDASPVVQHEMGTARTRSGAQHRLEAIGTVEAAEHDAGSGAAAVAGSLLFGAFARVMWRSSLQRYTSASS